MPSATPPFRLDRGLPCVRRLERAAKQRLVKRPNVPTASMTWEAGPFGARPLALSELAWFRSIGHTTMVAAGEPRSYELS